MSEGIQIRRVGQTIVAISDFTSLSLPMEGRKAITFEKRRGNLAAILRAIEAPQSKPPIIKSRLFSYPNTFRTALN